MKLENTRVKLTERRYAYLGDVRLPLRVVLSGLEFCVKEPWLRPEHGEHIVLTWDEIDRLRGVLTT